MAKFYGKIGFVKTEESEPGIWDSSTTEKSYYGDVLQNRYRWQSRNEVNEDFSLSMTVSILADPFAYDNLEAIKWVEYMGSKWLVVGINVEYPRIKLDLGGVYNE